MQNAESIWPQGRNCINLISRSGEVCWFAVRRCREQINKSTTLINRFVLFGHHFNARSKFVDAFTRNAMNTWQLIFMRELHSMARRRTARVRTNRWPIWCFLIKRLTPKAAAKPSRKIPQKTVLMIAAIIVRPRTHHSNESNAIAILWMMNESATQRKRYSEMSDVIFVTDFVLTWLYKISMHVMNRCEEYRLSNLSLQKPDAASCEKEAGELNKS